MLHLTKPMRRRYHPELSDEQFDREIQHSQAFINEQIAEVLASQEKQIREMSAAIRTLANELGALKSKSGRR